MSTLHATVYPGLLLALAFGTSAAARSQPAPASDRATRLEFVSAIQGLPTGGIWKSTPVVADFNADGFLDIAIHPRLDRTTRVFLGDGKGNWAESSEGLNPGMGTCGGGLAAGDVNKDGNLDLVVADHCSGVFVYLGDGKGHWKSTIKGLAPDAARHPKEEDDLTVFVGAEVLALADVNEDGALDIVSIASDRGRFTVWFGDGSGVRWREATQDGLPSAEDPPSGDEDDAGWGADLRLGGHQPRRTR